MASTSGRGSTPPRRRRRSSSPPAEGEAVHVRADVALALEIISAIENGMVDRLIKIDNGLKRLNSSLLEAVRAAMPKSVVDGLLHKAAERGLYETCKYLAKDLKLDVNGTIESGATPLISAVDSIASATSAHRKNEFARVVELLLRRGAEPNISKPDGVRAIHAATSRGSYAVAKILLENKAEVNAMCFSGTVLHIAAESGTDCELVNLLFQHGAKANATNANGLTALHVAARKDSRAIAKQLLEHDADVDITCDEGTALHIAVESGSVAFVELLLDHGADANKKNSSGLTAVHLATGKGEYDVAKVLLAKGADVDAECEMGTAVHLAAGLGDLKMLSLLLQHDADANLLDKNGRKAIEVAALRGCRGCVEVLFPYTDRMDGYPDWSIDGVLQGTKNMNFP